MEAFLPSHSQILLYSILFGLFLGLICDVFHIIHLVRKISSRVLFLQDVVYFFICGILTFLFLLVVNHGEIRFFIVIGEILGWSIYRLTLGKITNNVFKFVFSIIKKLFFVLKPFLSKLFLPIIIPIRNKIVLVFCNVFPNQKISSKKLKKT